jgi:hypothetical protein
LDWDKKTIAITKIVGINWIAKIMRIMINSGKPIPNIGHPLS